MLTDNSEQRLERFHLFFVALVEQISTLHHRRIEVIDGVTDVSRQQFIQATDKLLLFSSSGWFNISFKVTQL